MSTPRQAIWRSDTQFSDGAPTLTDVEVVGSGNAAYLALAEQVGVNHVPFTMSGNYAFDPTKIEVGGGAARLKAFVASDKDWPFTTPGNYTYDGNKIEVSGGVAKLKGSPITCYAQWHMNESNGTNVPDSSGNGRDATCVLMEDSDWTAGKLNNCLRFNEGGTTDEYVNCGQVAGFELNDTFSFDFWIKIFSLPSGNIRVAYKYDNSRGYLIYVGSSRVYVFILDKVLGGYIHLHGSTPIGLDTWYHVIITYNGSSVASGFEIYVDGNLNTKTVLLDNIAGGTITNSAVLKLGGSGVSYFLDGLLDEFVVYDKELNATEVAARWNGGAGTELMPGAYPVDNPFIYPNVGIAYAQNLGQFIETVTAPVGTATKYHVSPDDGVTWKYWNGSAWVTTDDSYSQANTAAVVNANISSLSATGTFRFRALLHSDDGSSTPELDNVYLAEGVSFPLGSFEIAMSTDIQPVQVSRWNQVVETVVKPTSTDITYQYSINSGVSYNGVWFTEAALEVALYALVLVGDGSDTLRIKALLSTGDLDNTPELDNIQIDDLHYPLSGSYESVQYAPPATYLNGLCATKITFSVVTPTGTSLSIEARFVDTVLEAGYSTLNSGNEFALCGSLIQWKATLATTDAGETPRLNELLLDFHTLVGVMMSIDETAALLRKLQTNRLEEQSGNPGSLTLWNDDDATPLLRWELRDEDGNATVKTQGAPARRSKAT